MITPPKVPATVVRYEPSGPTIKSFHESTAFVRGLMGPIGSSKSTACVVEILDRAMRQAPSPDGIRRTRWAIIRNSYPELKSTTIKTWAQWCPTHYGRLNMDSPITHHVKNEGLDMEVLFLALDRDEDVKKLLSLELTGAWVNEAREIPKAIIDALTGRVGRYPSRLQGGCTWSGVMMDTNPPDDQSWWYKLAETDVPEGWQFFQQPSGRSPQAENLQNLPKGYYTRIQAGKDADWIKVYVDGEYGYLTEGKPVYPMFRDSTHTAREPLAAIPKLPIHIGVDFGLTPAAIIGQKLADGRWLILDELTTDSTGVIRFAELLAQYVATNYADFEIGTCTGDPAGSARGQDERTAFELMQEYTGWKWKPAPSNDLDMRMEVVINALNRMVDGYPGMLVSPKAQSIRKGFTGGYHFQLAKSGNGVLAFDTPKKNKYSHPHDALQYLLLGAGEYDVVRRKVKKKNQDSSRPRVAEGMDAPVFGGSGREDGGRVARDLDSRVFDS